MDKDDPVFQLGLEMRGSVHGQAYVDKAFDTEDPHALEFQKLITTYAWGAVWGRRETLEHRTRSLLTLAMLTALNREHEFRVHVRGAIRNGCTQDEIFETIMQTAIYCGIPAAVDSFRRAKSVIAEMKANDELPHN